MADGRKRQVSGHQRLAVRRQLPQKTDPDAGRLLGVVFEAVVPVGVLEPDLEHGVAGERQPVAAGRQADHTVPGGMAAGALDDHPRRHLVLVLERPQLAVVLFQEPLARPAKRVGEPRRHGDAGEIGRLPEASAAATWTRRSGRSRSFTPSASSPPQWSMCMWVSTTSVTDAGSMPAAFSRWANFPARGKSGNSIPIPTSMSMVRPPLRTTTTFSAHSSTSDGRNMSSSQAARTAGSTLWPNIEPGSDSTPSLTTITSISPTFSA